MSPFLTILGCHETETRRKTASKRISFHHQLEQFQSQRQHTATVQSISQANQVFSHCILLWYHHVNFKSSHYACMFFCRHKTMKIGSTYVDQREQRRKIETKTLTWMPTLTNFFGREGMKGSKNLLAWSWNKWSLRKRKLTKRTMSNFLLNLSRQTSSDRTKDFQLWE